MATRPKGYGLTAEINRKIRDKYDENLEQEARCWIEELLGEELVPGSDPNQPIGRDNMHKVLKNGVILCRIMNLLQPDKKPIKLNTQQHGFFLMENIGKFLEAADKFGLEKSDQFATADLYENTNMTQVIRCLDALGRKARQKGFQGPTIGVKQSDHNPRNFSKEKLAEGQTIIGLQMGSNSGANQQGINFGKTRSITD